MSGNRLRVRLRDTSRRGVRASYSRGARWDALKRAPTLSFFSDEAV